MRTGFIMRFRTRVILNTLYLILEKYLILISRILAGEVLSIDFRT